jgi:putrescine transport system substrate-binding protein
MSCGKQLSIATLCVTALFIVGCDNSHSGNGNIPSAAKHDDDKVVNLFIWSDYLAPDTISSFEKQTGIKVRVGYIDSLETLQTRMLTGNSGFDVVDPSGAFYFKQEIRSGAYLPLDKAKLPNRSHLDPELMSRIEPNDPGNAHGVIYTWGTIGIGYNEKMLRERLPNVPLNSWRLLFDPVFAAKLATCGINFVDDSIGVVQIALKYLGRDPSASSPRDLADVDTLLTNIRPFVRNIDTSSEIEAMANGDVCVSLAYNGDFVQARNRAKEAKNGIVLKYVIPEEGSILWFSLLAIPKDAPHVANAHLLINYLMNPQIIANITNSIGYANANTAATPLLDASIASDTAIYPTRDEQQRLFLPAEESPEQTRAITRLWQKFKTGQ